MPSSPGFDSSALYVFIRDKATWTESEIHELTHSATSKQRKVRLSAPRLSCM
jgi:hypothetical protein